MIALIESLNFRCLRYVRQELGPFHILVGPNASGKTTFLDTIAFLGRLVSDGLDAAINERTQDFRDLVWRREAGQFELAVEVSIPDRLLVQLPQNRYNRFRYQVRVGTEESFGEVAILAETGLLIKHESSPSIQRELFPMSPQPPESIQSSTKSRQVRTVFNKVPGGNDNFYSEVYGEAGKGWAPAFRLGARKSTLANLPEDESKFPVATWLKSLLTRGVERFVLNTLAMRRASPPGQVRGFKTDGSNLPWVIYRLEKKDKARFRDWMSHIQTALPDVVGIKTTEREDDRHRYLTIEYRQGLQVPSWVASDGTLRLLALTLPAYLRDFGGVYLIEEPENGIHPQAVETVIQALSSVYDAQILVATHSPVVLSTVEPAHILCFAKDGHGATDIVAGSQHPRLRDWKQEENLSVLFAAGILG